MSKILAYTTPEGEKAYRVVMLLNRTKPHKLNLIDDYDLIQQYALRKKQQEVVDEWIEEKAASNFIRILDENYSDCRFSSKWINTQEEIKQ